MLRIWVVVVVRLPRPMEGNGLTLFSDPYRTANSTTGGWSRWHILMCFIYIYYIYNSEHYGLSFLDLTDAFFLQGVSAFIICSGMCACTEML